MTRRQRPLPDPLPLTLPDGIAAPADSAPGVSAAADLIAQAVIDRQRIAVFCDYDPDGTCGGEVMRIALSHAAPCTLAPGLPRGPACLFGYASAQAGYGIDERFVRAAAGWGATLLVTVDVGSGHPDRVAEAQQLGMRVVVTDHHQITADSPADVHCNPALNGPSQMSGSVVAWKVALEVARRLPDGQSALDELLTRGAWLAHFGARSDWMDFRDPELQALAQVADRVAERRGQPQGVRDLARRFGFADTQTVEAFTALDELLNLPKRTPLADAADAARILGAGNRAAARDATARLVAVKERSDRTLRAMTEQARARVIDHGRLVSAFVDVDGCEDFTGHAGNVAHDLNVRCGKPAIALLSAPADPWGAAQWRWAARHNAGPNCDRMSFADALPAIRAASLVRQPDQDGRCSYAPSAGGHPKAVSGRVAEGRADRLIDTLRAWADRCDAWVSPSTRDASVR